MSGARQETTRKQARAKEQGHHEGRSEAETHRRDRFRMIALASPNDPRVIRLMNAQQDELRAIYEDDATRTEPFDPSVLRGDGCVLLADEREGELVACGALKRWEDGRTAEIKRMYTAPAWRGRGLGEALLDALIARGRALGYERLSEGARA